MSITRPNPFQKAGDASKLSAAQLQLAIKDGTVPPYIGIPLLQEKVKMEKQMQAAMASQQPKPPTVADQVMAEAAQTEAGVPGLRTGLPTAMAGGGIVAFADGGMYEDDDTEEDRLDQARANELDSLMDEYAGLGALAASMPEGKTKVTTVEVTDGKGGLHPELASRVEELKAGYREKFGKELPITSGFRTRADQERLYAERGSNPNPVAKPGSSKHEHGMAVDMPAHIPEEFLRQYGLHRPHGKKDPVHVEMMSHGGEVPRFNGQTGSGIRDVYSMTPDEIKEQAARKLRMEAARAGLSTAPETAAAAAETPSLWEAAKSAVGRIRPGIVGWGAALHSGDLNSNEQAELDKRWANLNQSPAETARLAQQDRSARGTPIGSVAAPAAPANTSANPAPAPAAMDKAQDQIDAGTNARIDKMMAAPKEPSELDQFKDMFAKREAGIASQREQDKYLAMLSAGLGIMGGTSHNAFANIGQGAQLGIQSLAQSNAARTAEQNALLSGRLGLAKIGAAERQALASQELRREMQAAALGQQKTLASERSLANAQALGIRQEDKNIKLLADLEDKARKAGEKKAELDPKFDVDAYVQKALRGNKVYGPLYQEVYKRNPFESVDTSSDNTGWSIKPK